MEGSETGPRHRRFYRLVTTDPPTAEDFMAYDALGKTPPRSKRDDTAFMRRWKGLSVYDTYRAARNLAEARSFERWRYIAVLDIPGDAPIVYEGPGKHGHWNLYNADPIFLKDLCMVRLVHARSIDELSIEV